MSTLPPAGTSADEGSTVTVTVRLGLTIKVPDVTGQDDQRWTAQNNV